MLTIATCTGAHAPSNVGLDSNKCHTGLSSTGESIILLQGVWCHHNLTCAHSLTAPFSLLANTDWHAVAPYACHGDRLACLGFSVLTHLQNAARKSRWAP
ncbi:hypothetical protein BCR34DRAFT_338912 [Clohesyomyces aquaticus]|uniref:Uncharacterized protein n=1 Tax=Clohesyomyces aquaticus TaxID=1231657 RepID=A0A1Y1ZM41_9PLEO|nr:hypothetical protein BCR34DRAFT_338912 [Clohesyomyces aquaticus]